MLQLALESVNCLNYFCRPLLDTYLNTKTDSLLRIVRNHQKRKKKYSVTSQGAILRREPNLPNTPQLKMKLQAPMLGR